LCQCDVVHLLPGLYLIGHCPLWIRQDGCAIPGHQCFRFIDIPASLVAGTVLSI
jgi:hypothetical protein